MHEGITGRSRDILLQTKDIADEMNFQVLHGIVDCLWVQGSTVDALKERVERETGLVLEVEHFDWIVFLPLADGFGAYNRYYGRQPDGSINIRGIAARRHDTPSTCGRCSAGCSRSWHVQKISRNSKRHAKKLQEFSGKR